MIITTTKRKATRFIGTRVVATSDDNHMSVTLWDYNASDETNHARAALEIFPDLVVIAHRADGYVWETR